jgi:hypothetical protein
MITPSPSPDDLSRLSRDLTVYRTLFAENPTASWARNAALTAECDRLKANYDLLKADNQSLYEQREVNLAERDRLRAALVGLVGSDDPNELAAIRAFTVEHAPNETAILTAVDLLLETGSNAPSP